MDSGSRVRADDQGKVLDRVFASMPWLRPDDRRLFRVKVFKSGNSLALRLPAGLDLAAGMEMELTVDQGDRFSFGPADRPRRKFAIAKVAGSASSLVPIAPEDRVFEDRPLGLPDREGGTGALP